MFFSFSDMILLMSFFLSATLHLLSKHRTAFTLERKSFVSVCLMYMPDYVIMTEVDSTSRTAALVLINWLFII